MERKKVRDIECLIFFFFFALKENTGEKKFVKQEPD